MKKRKKPVKKGLYQAKNKAEFQAAEQRLLDRIKELNDGLLQQAVAVL